MKSNYEMLQEQLRIFRGKDKVPDNQLFFIDGDKIVMFDPNPSALNAFKTETAVPIRTGKSVQELAQDISDYAFSKKPTTEERLTAIESLLNRLCAHLGIK